METSIKVIRFILKGRTAFFKKPDVNVNTYFTYSNIHKIALLGMLGALLGLEGYHQQNRKLKEQKDSENLMYPEFYQKLHLLKIAIRPLGAKGYFHKKIQTFNNSVGYASKEKGGNLIIREQWLENPSWEIYILKDGSIDEQVFQQLEDHLLSRKCKYMPYLGKNDHPAEITDVEIAFMKKAEHYNHIDTLFKESCFKFGNVPYDENLDVYFFREESPCSLDLEYNYYEFMPLCFTNLLICPKDQDANVYQLGDSFLCFY